jgi:MoaA/NifB/PqqE/SkfB family radical SAM enzyme
VARSVFANGMLPTDFSINLGVAPCNHSCLFCPQSVKKPKKAHWLELDLLGKVLSEMPEQGVRINISSYSETLAAPNLVPAVQLMKQLRPKLPISMATNGSLYREEVIEQLIDAGLDHYQLSFDAPTRESYARLMQVDHFDRISDNMVRLITMRDRKGSNMMITTHVMEFIEIGEENEAFLEHWRGRLRGTDRADLRRVGNWGGEVWGLTEQLKAAGFTPKFSAPAKRYPCNSIFMHFKMQHDGRYAPCVAAVPDYAPEEELHKVGYLGDAREITWGEAWRRLSEMRRAHLEGRWDDHECCRTCNIWGLWENVWTERGVAADVQTRFHIDGVDHAR